MYSAEMPVIRCALACTPQSKQSLTDTNVAASALQLEQACMQDCSCIDRAGCYVAGAEIHAFNT